jgi:hypothetical protein
MGLATISNRSEYGAGTFKGIRFCVVTQGNVLASGTVHRFGPFCLDLLTGRL